MIGIIPIILLSLMGLCVVALIYCWIMIAISSYRINKLDEQMEELEFVHRDNGE